ncbi:MAG: hypothetical protein A2528_02355 [Candidatus Staskawiczbacteria bacterium RIFOXYD2_FULL_37_9]|uniref:Type IV pilus modification protein PilV n=1 Tax=Candidatus Staskawiczbacteria bacterium RIFOXYB1_FULL_37_44 TaxID=1802223 RepID=A0A1G2IXP2_9BACT|nr:MAG: hypothetical protein A2358_04305 [Candidatus Staskawiczbacteria bacterium RIFOXYB1_FULL_37_44]OGZ84787.1 MAG: hypothetical protein A2416_00535 [Candidatus Staskawiczbacteria bacterium RIFOXYC1_FULL_37_52]OGZ88076.1 MAG: hypothetical protein A2444_00320 [Candidatus Staskawiczbacteria bacterium RIFOXYC2_FULL_37_19]OGZ90401.1 MAG: hypothetical protein A2581_03475 [Candidatus Staskawiczbacteria bacterium RIFOXYD1_FULL_37_110]OGZ93451.1 MAG: hypothetical protein A2528_02355 [Candidatus Stask
MKNSKFKNKGFTIIELVISIFVLSIGVIGTFSAFSLVFILTSNTADQLTATYLAQEGMEIVRNIRDNNWLKIDTCPDPDPDACSYKWTAGLDICAADKGCQADYSSTSMFGGSGDYLYLNDKGFYAYNPANPDSKETKFKRKIIIKCENDDCENAHFFEVITQVSWKQKASIINAGVADGECTASNCVITEETLYNWY